MACQKGPKTCCKGCVDLTIDSFGEMETENSSTNKSITRFTWKTKNNLEVQVISYGVTITSIKLNDKQDKVGDLVLGFDDMPGYQQKRNPFFGATVGRVANRTGNGAFSIGDNKYTLTKNRDPNHLHGGFFGFDKANWDYVVDGTKVIFSYLSKDGEEGYPGNLLSTVTVEVTPKNAINIKMESVTTKPTPVNLTNHSYFNLAGHDAGPDGLYDHVVTINADKYTLADATSVTTGEFGLVADTPFDFRVSKRLGDVISNTPTKGYDMNYCITKGSNQTLGFVSRVYHPKSGRYMEVYSNQPGVQFYTSNFLPNPQAADYLPLNGKGGVPYTYQGGFCLETQNYPNAVNHKHFPNAVLYPGKTYFHEVQYAFGVVS